MTTIILGSALCLSLIYIFVQNRKFKTREKSMEIAMDNAYKLETDIDVLRKERKTLLEDLYELKETNRELGKENYESQKCWEELKKINDESEVENEKLIDKYKEYVSELENCNENLKTKVKDLESQIKLEDEASCKIIKELEQEKFDQLHELAIMLNDSYKVDEVILEKAEKLDWLVNNANREQKRNFIKGCEIK